MNWIYLDNAATTQPAPEAISAMMPYLTDYWANPSSIYTFGSQLNSHLDRTRHQIATLIHAKHATEITFTSGGTESNNLAIRGVLTANPEKNHIVTTSVEHSSVDKLCKSLQKSGVEITFLKVDSEGAIDLDELKKSIGAKTALVTIMWANNETGIIFPVEKIADICQQKGVLFHTDAIQSVGKVPVDLSKIPADLLSISGHKIHSPKGVGALYVKRGTKINPILIGGGQERGRRGGTENVPGIMALGKAAELASGQLQDAEKIGALRNKTEEIITTTIPDAIINGKKSRRVPNITNISFPGLESEAILMMLSEHGVCASSGSACTSFSVEPSRILIQMGLGQSLARSAIRLSFSHNNTPDDVKKLIEILSPVVTRLKKINGKLAHING